MKKIMLLSVLLAVLGSCNDPIFYTISLEPPPIEPRIKGGPANMVEFDNAMFVASGQRLYRYDGDWETFSTPAYDKIAALAVLDDNLYALCYKYNGSRSSSSIIKYSLDDDTWENISNSDKENNSYYSIYAAGGKLIIGAEKNNNRFILYYDKTDNEIKKIQHLPNLDYDLCAAASDGSNIYLGTTSKKVIKFPLSDPNLAVEIDVGNSLCGMINLNNTTIAAISRRGEIFIINAAGINSTGISFDSYATGALALWIDKEDNAERLLLAGRQDSLTTSINTGYTYGYLELKIGANNEIIPGSSFTEPGRNNISSVNDNERYKSTIGIQPVKHLHQISSSIDEEMTLFASTQKKGLWSYKKRGGTWQWNAEE